MLEDKDEIHDDEKIGNNNEKYYVEEKKKLTEEDCASNDHEKNANLGKEDTSTRSDDKIKQEKKYDNAIARRNNEA